MEYNVQDIITFADDKKYMVMSKAIHEDVTYMFLMNVDEDKDYKFVNLNDEKKLFEIKNQDVITNIAPLLYKNLLEEIEKI